MGVVITARDVTAQKKFEKECGVQLMSWQQTMVCHVVAVVDNRNLSFSHGPRQHVFPEDDEDEEDEEFDEEDLKLYEQFLANQQ